MGEVEVVTQRDLSTPLDVIPESWRNTPWAFSTAGSRSRLPSRSRSCAARASSWDRPSSWLRTAVGPGITTRELDALAEDNIRSTGRPPTFQGYHGFPATICASVNDEVVHGIPGDRVLGEGDVISIDCGAIVEGWHGDAAITVAMGDGPGPSITE